jgi:aspartyl-tRNA(Asn)/glutamyl-tRNA(Gln) amidotransferase subunit B
MAQEKRRDPAEGTPFEAVIGLEVHVQLKTRSKMFCGCENRFGAEPNSLTCPVCLGQPGSLPAINRAAVEHAVRVGLACGGDIARFTKFDRKNYYYPDLPKNYQISQFDLPISSGGGIDIFVGGEKKRIGLTRVHLEEDAGKNIHVEGQPESLVDLNRAGVPLLEIVSQPDMRTATEAGAYLRMLRQIMLYLGVSDCNMEEGSLRCDTNVSIRARGSDRLETRTEIKNLNSFTNVENALDHEITRQIKVRSGGKEVIQQTLLFDPERGETRVLRGKEEAHDYRYFPEPDLAPLHLDEKWIELLREGLPELPADRLERYRDALGLSHYHADVLVRDRDLADFFDECVGLHPKPQEIANWVLNAVKEETNERGKSVREIGLTAARLVDLVKAIEGGKVSKQKARDVFKAMLGTEDPVGKVIESLGLGQVSDDALLRSTVEAVIRANPGAVEDVRKGKKNSVNFLMGQVMRETKGQANPAVVTRLIQEVIG